MNNKSEGLLGADDRTEDMVETVKCVFRVFGHAVAT